jgi:hypothetical protein
MQANYQHYEILKAALVSAHPDATPAEYEAAIKRIAAHCGV